MTGVRFEVVPISTPTSLRNSLYTTCAARYSQPNHFWSQGLLVSCFNISADTVSTAYRRTPVGTVHTLFTLPNIDFQAARHVLYLGIASRYLNSYLLLGLSE